MSRKHVNRIIAYANLILLPVLGIAFAVVLRLSHSAAPSSPTVVFRCDDYPNRPYFHVDREIIRAFADFHYQCTFGVVPFPLKNAATNAERETLTSMTAEQIQVLRQAVDTSVIDVGLHGYRHEKAKGRSEFAGLPYAEQRDRMAKGKSTLEKHLGVTVDTLIPPWNRYDGNTLNAMRELGMTCLAATVSRRTESSGAVRYVPRTCGLDAVRGAVETARKRGVTQNALVVCLFHAYDFLESGERETATLPLGSLRDLLSWLRAEGVPVLSIGQVLTTEEDLSGKRQLANRIVGILTPPFLRPSNDLYLRVQSCRQILALGGIVYTADGIMAFSIVFVLMGALASRRPRLAWLVTLWIAIACTGMAYYWLGHVSRQDWCVPVLVFLAGAFGGAMAATLPVWGSEAESVQRSGIAGEKASDSVRVSG